MTTATPPIQQTLQQWAQEFDARLREYLKPEESVPAVLVEAIQYSVLAPGKRLRPFIVDRCYRIAGGEVKDG